MTYTVTLLGAQVETTADNVITVANASTASGDSLVIFAGGHDAPGEPVVDYGGVTIVGDDWRIAPGSKLSGGIWQKDTIWNGRTDDVTVTFGSSVINAGSFVIGKAYKIVTLGTTDFTLIGAASNTIGLIFTATGVGSGTGTARTQMLRRFCIVYRVTNGGRKDQVKRNVQDTATTDPNTLLSAALGINNELMLAYHLSNGPVTDVAGTPTGDMVLLDRIGTTTGTDDITIQTTTLETEATDAVRSYMTGATSRQWLNALIMVRPLVPVAALDANGSELQIGDSVKFEGVNSTISSFIREFGSPVVVVVLANGVQTYSYYLELNE